MSKSNIFSRSNIENSVFLDERYLYSDFVPDRLPHRDKEIDSLVYCFEPVLKGRRITNVFVAGPTGVGKTVSLKFVLRQLEDYSDRAKSLYLNCFEYNSRASILTAIANFAGAALPRRGLATDEIFSTMLESLRKCGFVPIVILDEVDQLLLNSSSSKLLYDLLRVVEYEKQSIGIAMISNDIELPSKLETRVKSSLAQNTLIFNSYSPDQLKKILSERVDVAFVKSAVDKEVIDVAAARAARLGGDCRVALEALLKAGRIAEKENASKVTVQHLQLAFDSADSVSLLKGVKHLDEDEKILLKIIANESGINSGKIYSVYSSLKKEPLKERRLRDVLAVLEKQNYIESKQVSMGNMGKTKAFVLRVPKDSLLKELS
ncbi:MAG: hypothetical protein COV47_02170 [Candidatus Diapherotrites archaeon CG11_big_fil_rev_8_21_14_0_20_37_9]|nr:MAG: hypothetical protein COV47_02170 [Candidatus Diapherotrites archaeon CG11_big_fil_rev_8_21_14_0_20_37_9]